VTETVVAPRDIPRNQATPTSDRSIAENRLGIRLVAPAVVLMLLVTAYPMLQALYLSLFKYRLTVPDDKSFTGLGNYATVLDDSLFWKNMLNTVIIMSFQHRLSPSTMA